MRRVVPSLWDVNDELRVVIQNGANRARLRSEVPVGWVGQIHVEHLVAFQGVVDDHANEDILHQLPWRECDRAGLVFEVFSHQRRAFDRFKVDRHLLIVGCIEANFQLEVGVERALKGRPVTNKLNLSQHRGGWFATIGTAHRHHGKASRHPPSGQRHACHSSSKMRLKYPPPGTSLQSPSI